VDLGDQLAIGDRRAWSGDGDGARVARRATIQKLDRPQALAPLERAG